MEGLKDLLYILDSREDLTYIILYLISDICLQDAHQSIAEGLSYKHL